MFTAVRRFASNTLTGVPYNNDCNGSSVNLLAGCYYRKISRTVGSSGGGLKAIVTTGLLFILGALYCLYSANNSTGRIVTTVTLGHQPLDTFSFTSVQSDVVAVSATIDGGNTQSNLRSGNSNTNEKKPWKKEPKLRSTNGVVTAADMYEPGFRIRNAGLCSPHTRLLVLITSAALPAHSQNRQAIRMTWMNRYGPAVSMAFLVGTPLMSETDSVAQVLESEEEALKIHLGKKNINSSGKSKESPKSSLSMASAADDSLEVNKDSKFFRFSKNQESYVDEGLDEQAMNGLNRAEQTVQRVLGREHSRYGDIVECQSRDSYTNLTLKSIAALEWTREYCPWAQYLLKTDDDMFIDVHRLLKFINKVEIEANSPAISSEPIDMKANVFADPNISDLDVELPPTIWGRLAHGWRPIRQNNSKYFVSRTQYSGRVYPDFCTGPAYLMTRSAVYPLYEAALGKDFDLIDDEDNYFNRANKMYTKLSKSGNVDRNQTLVKKNLQQSAKNTVPYLKLEDVYLTGVVAERLTRRAVEREEQKKKEKMSSNKGDWNTNNISNKTESQEQADNSKINRSKTANIIVKIRRIHNNQFANKKITGRALERAVCNGVNSGNIVGNGGFSWFRWYWGDISLNKKQKMDPGVISIHMVKYYEQFDLWRRLMDGRTKCKI